MVQDITTYIYMYFAFLAVSIWVIYKYADLIHLDWIIMLLWFPIIISTITILESDGWDIFVELGGFILVEYLAFMNLLNNYNRNKSRRHR